jgi:hypothetical protein
VIIHAKWSFLRLVVFRYLSKVTTGFVIVYFQISSSECGLMGTFQIDIWVQFIIKATVLNVVYNKQTQCDLTQR